MAETIEFEGPETVAMVIMEPVQNAGGCFTPHPQYHQRVREICDEYGVLQCADEVICGFGRVGEWFGSIRYDYRPDLMTTAKGLTSAYQPMGALLFSDRIAERLLAQDHMYMHGVTFGGHPIAAAVALKNIEIMEREGVIDNVRANQGYLEDALRGLMARHEIIGDVRGAGYFWAMELVKDRATRETFTPEECDVLLRDFLSHALLDEGLICRQDDRGDPVIQISPPLIATREHIDEAVAIFDRVLPRAMERMRAGLSPGRTVLTVGDVAALPGLGLAVAAGAGGLEREVRWVASAELARPDAVPGGRRAAADDRARARRRGAGAGRLRRAARGARASPAWASGSGCATRSCRAALVATAERLGLPLPGGAVRDAVRRHHEGRDDAHRQRALRRPGAPARGAGRVHRARAGAPRARRDPRRGGDGGRRRRAAGSARPAAGAAPRRPLAGPARAGGARARRPGPPGRGDPGGGGRSPRSATGSASCCATPPP